MKNYCSMSEQPKLDCLHCKEIKPLTRFKKDQNMERGYMRMCRECYNEKYRKPKSIPPPIEYLEGEIWKFTLNNHYKISNKGRLMSLNFKGQGYPSLLALPNSKGYKRIALTINGNKNYSIHRLVATAFIPNTDNKPFINHKNGIRHDNRVENLEWCTARENIIHAYTTGLASNKGERHSRASITDETAREIKIMLSSGYSRKDISDKLKVNRKLISNIACGRRWNHIKI